MMGKDCERIVAGINNIYNAANEVLMVMRGFALGPIETPGFIEKKIVVPGNIFKPVTDAKNLLIVDFDFMEVLKKKLYTSTTSFNNSVGSPWTEFKSLRDDIERAQSVIAAGLEYKSTVLATMPLVSAILTSSVRATHAMIIHHDYIQRGYDAEFNGRRPSITFKKTKKKRSIGNINQNYAENVNIEITRLDPF